LLLEILAFVLGLGVRCWSGESTDQTLRSISVLAAVLLGLCSVPTPGFPASKFFRSSRLGCSSSFGFSSF
jgi:hypothetical protein